MKRPLFLSYSGCGTCKSALRWLADRSIAVDVRPIVEQPPTRDELERWIPMSGRPARKWLNTSGQSYRALGKATFDALDDRGVVERLAADGKLVKRPVLVTSDRVLVGFDAEHYASAFG
jgi:arsenate reductase